jgi:hypothetical protein
VFCQGLLLLSGITTTVVRDNNYYYLSGIIVVVRDYYCCQGLQLLLLLSGTTSGTSVCQGLLVTRSPQEVHTKSTTHTCRFFSLPVVQHAGMAALRRDVAGTANAANTANTADTGTASCGGSIGTGSTGTGSISTGSTGTAASGSTSDPAFSVVSAEDLHAALAKVTPSAMREVVVEVPEVRWSDIGGKHRRLVAGILVQLNASLTHILSKLSLQTLSPNSLCKRFLQNSLQTLSKRSL